MVKTYREKGNDIHFFITFMWGGLCSICIGIICHFYIERHISSESHDSINQGTCYVTLMVLRATLQQLVIFDLETYFRLSGFVACYSCNITMQTSDLQCKLCH